MKLNFSVWALGFGFGNLLNCIFSSDSTGVIQFFNTLCILFIVIHIIQKEETIKTKESKEENESNETIK